MDKLASNEFLESLKQTKDVTTEPLQQPRGLSVPTSPPPADLAATPGVADSAERAAHRAAIIALLRKQQEELPIVAADQAFRGALAGAATGLGLLLLRSLFSARPPEREYPEQEYYDE
jgi:hypothetical protein